MRCPPHRALRLTQQLSLPSQHQRKDARSCPFNRHGNTYSAWKDLEEKDKLCRHSGCEQVKPNCVCCAECDKPRSLHGSHLVHDKEVPGGLCACDGSGSGSGGGGGEDGSGEGSAEGEGGSAAAEDEAE